MLDNSLPRRLFVMAALLTLVATVPVATVLSEAAGRDARWDAWLGCWTSVGQAGNALDASARYVCIVPAEGVSAVDIATVSDGQVVSRERIDASGVRRTDAREGCKGWESARWSSDGHRVYLQSQYECTGGVRRSTTTLIATSAVGDWVDIVGVAMRDGVGVRVLRHRPIQPPSTVPAEITAALPSRTARVDAFRTAASSPIGDSEIIDASRHVSAPVVEAWLAESRQAFTIGAKRLVALADAGVDARVIDMMVGLSYPNAFSVRPSPTDVGSLAEGGGGGGGGRSVFGGSSSLFGLGLPLLECGPYSPGLSLYGWDDCSPYGYPSYPMRYGFSPYGDLFGYSGWYVAGGDGAAILVRPSDTSGAHGKVINGRGYSSGGGDSGGSGTSSTGTSSGGSPGISSGGGSSGGGRTAVPR